MRAKLDEAVPRQLVGVLAQHDCAVEPFPLRWKGVKNGQLLKLMEENEIGCLVTSDRNMQWQQPIAQGAVGVVVLPGQTLLELEPLAGTIAVAIRTLRPGQIARIDPTDRTSG